jgi:hypothetical protein
MCKSISMWQMVHWMPQGTMRLRLAGAQNFGECRCCYSQLSGCGSWAPPQKCLRTFQKAKGLEVVTK